MYPNVYHPQKKVIYKESVFQPRFKEEWADLLYIVKLSSASAEKACLQAITAHSRFYFIAVFAFNLRAC